MNRKGIVKWNTNQLQMIKKHLLFFDELYYDPKLYGIKENIFRCLEVLFKKQNKDFNVRNEINATILYLEKKSVLKQFDLLQIRKSINDIETLNMTDKLIFSKEVQRYSQRKDILWKKHDMFIDAITKEKNVNKGLQTFIEILKETEKFSDYHVNLSSIIYNHKEKSASYIPIVDQLNSFEEGKPCQVVRLVINQLPIPDDNVPLDELLDFRNDENNRRKYLALITWMNKITKSSLNVKEIEGELHHLMSEFDYRMGLEKKRFKTGTLQLILPITLEVLQNLLTIRWTEIGKSLLKIKHNKLNLLLAETKATGREIAYISSVNEKFAKK